jgi:hypothetical protein
MPHWLAVAFVAGVISAIVNVACNVIARKRGATRTVAARLHAERHTALAVAIKLEDFARQCQATIVRADRTDMVEQQHVLLGDIELPPFAFADEIQWRDLDAGKASYLRAFDANVTYSADLIRSNDRCSNVAEFVANIKGHCAELGRRAWLMAVELREENELRAVEDHDCVIEFDAALSEYFSWKERQRVRSVRVAAVQPQASHGSRPSPGRGGAAMMGDPA